MPFLNTVTLMGHLTADIEIKRISTGDSVATFTIGVNSGRAADKAKKGQFFRCDIWGAWAENLAKTARKGSLVIVQGRLAQDRWIDAKTNQVRSMVKVRASCVFHVTAQYSSPHPEEEGGQSDQQQERAHGEEESFESEEEEGVFPQLKSV